MEVKDPLSPPMAVLAKLSAIVVHYEEWQSDQGHPFDKTSLDMAINDPEVQAWVRNMTTLGFAPVKRQGGGATGES